MKNEIKASCSLISMVSDLLNLDKIHSMQEIKDMLCFMDIKDDKVIYRWCKSYLVGFKGWLISLLGVVQ